MYTSSTPASSCHVAVPRRPGGWPTDSCPRSASSPACSTTYSPSPWWRGGWANSTTSAYLSFSTATRPPISNLSTSSRRPARKS